MWGLVFKGLGPFWDDGLGFGVQVRFGAEASGAVLSIPY